MHIVCPVCVCHATGILVVKKKLFRNPVPSVCGGGTVFFVSWLNSKANTLCISSRILFYLYKFDFVHL